MLLLVALLLLLPWHARAPLCSLQAQRVCPRFARVNSVGVEVVHVCVEASYSHSPGFAPTQWSPDAESIAHVVRGRGADSKANTLVMTSVATGCQHVVVPPMSPVDWREQWEQCFWAPSSRLLVSITGSNVIFVDRQTCMARLHQTSLPNQGVRLLRVRCGRAGLIALVYTNNLQGGVITICSLVGAPKRLHVLRHISTGRLALSLVLSPSGLLAAWVDCDDVAPAPHGEDIVALGMPYVRICELTSGRCAKPYDMPGPMLAWQP